MAGVLSNAHKEYGITAAPPVMTRNSRREITQALHFLPDSKRWMKTNSLHADAA